MDKVFTDQFRVVFLHPWWRKWWADLFFPLERTFRSSGNIAHRQNSVWNLSYLCRYHFEKVPKWAWKLLNNFHYFYLSVNCTVLPKDSWCFWGKYKPIFNNFFCGWACGIRLNFWHHFQPHGMSVLPDLAIPWEKWVNKFHPMGL